MALLADAMKDYEPSNEENTVNETVENTEENITEQPVSGETTDTTETTVPDNAETTTEEPAKPESNGIEFVSDDSNTGEVVVDETTETPDTTQTELVIDENLDISSHTNGEYSKVEDLMSDFNALKESTLTGENLFELLDKQSEEHFGLTYSELVAWQNTDYDSMSERDVLAEKMEMEDPEITRDEIDFELAKYDLLNKTQDEIAEMIDDKEISQREYDILKNEFNRSVRLGRSSLKKFRDENIDLSKISVNTQAQKQEQYQPTEEEVNKSKEDMRADLNGFSNLKMNVGDKDGNSVNFKIDDSEKDSLVDTLSDPSWLAKRWTNEDGSTNKNRAYMDAYIIQNVNKMLKAAYSEGIAKGAKETVVNEDNITLGNAKPVPSSGKKDPLAEAGDKLAQNYF